MTPDATRRRLLDGVLLRLANCPDAAAFAVRGGVLLARWFAPVNRPVEDVDLVAGFPHDVADTARRVVAILADDSVLDGVRFDAERAHAEGIWLDSVNPGVRVFADGTFEGAEAELHVDVTFGPPPRPVARWADLATDCGRVARVLACRPESVAGHKVQALWHRGKLGWRPKDLSDLARLLAGVPMDAAELRAAIASYLEDVGVPAPAAAELFGPASWWGTKSASARWLDFAEARPGTPTELAAVIHGVRDRLTVVMGGGT